MKSKLGLYLISTGDAPISWFEKAKPAIAVSMCHDPNYWREVKRVSPGTFILGRHYFENQNTDGASWFNAMSIEILTMKDIYDAWMGTNEPAIWNQGDAEALRNANFTWSSLMHQAGIKTAAYSFSEGHPDQSLLPFLKNHGCDYYCRHEYDAAEMWRTQPWRCLRYRSERSYFPQPFIIGETGIDGGVSGIDKPQTGWKGFGDESHYLQSLQWYDSELQKDSYVVGAAIFAAKWDTGNSTFDMVQCNQIRDYIGIEQPVPTSQAIVEEALKHKWMPINTNAALYRWAIAHDLGYPQTDEIEFGYYIFQVFNGGIVYCRKGNWDNVMFVEKPKGT
jgi:hypothetical protein